MKINTDYNNVNFGQKFPTEPLLKMALEIWDFDAAKAIYLASSNKFPGHISYYKRAVNIAKQVQANNPEFANIVNKLKNFSSKNEKLEQIRKISSELGAIIDVNI